MTLARAIANVISDGYAGQARSRLGDQLGELFEISHAFAALKRRCELFLGHG